MRKVDRSIVYNENNRKNIPSAYVDAGETFIIETELCTGGWLQDENDKWSPEKTTANNPCVCIGVNGAKPGDILKIVIEDIVVDGLGYMALETYQSVFPKIAEDIFGEIFSHTMLIKDGYVSVSSRVKIPIRPMIGTLSTTLDKGIRSNTWAGYYGGNLDVQEIGIGACVYLPVFVEGALLNIGDVHAIQSDGEISAVECRSEIKLRIEVEKNIPYLNWPRIIKDGYLITVGCAKTEMAAFETAFGELLKWIHLEKNLTKQEAYMLLAAAMEARCTVCINPGFYTYVCKIRKAFLDDKMN